VNEREKEPKLRIGPAHMPVLRGRSRPVTKVTEAERGLLAGMLRLMYDSKGLGLAAPQVGIDARLIVVDIGAGPLQLVNPVIERQGRKTSGRAEGCLSLPKISVTVRRPESVVVLAHDEQDRPVRFSAAGLLSRVVQHEIDHLDGTLIIDYLPWFKRRVQCRQLGIAPRISRQRTRGLRGALRGKKGSLLLSYLMIQ